MCRRDFSAEKLLLLMDAVVTGVLSDDELSLKAENKSLLTANIITLCENLKIFGPQLEESMYRGNFLFTPFTVTIFINHWN